MFEQKQSEGEDDAESHSHGHLLTHSHSTEQLFHNLIPNEVGPAQYTVFDRTLQGGGSAIETTNVRDGVGCTMIRLDYSRVPGDRSVSSFFFGRNTACLKFGLCIGLFCLFP